MFFFFKQKTAYEMRISDWSSDVCSSDLVHRGGRGARDRVLQGPGRLLVVVDPPDADDLDGALSGAGVGEAGLRVEVELDVGVRGAGVDRLQEVVTGSDHCATRCERGDADQSVLVQPQAPGGGVVARGPGAVAGRVARCQAVLMQIGRANG